MEKIGIYSIKNKITGQYYIGQSIDIERRKRTHFYNLKNDSHINNYLQNSFNYYGEDAFEFKIMCECSKEELDEKEIEFMKLYDAQVSGFNICDCGTHLFPDNSNENHGMWRIDISNERIKALYLQDYNSKQLSEIFDCSIRTINRRLVKIFGQEEYNRLKREKQVKNIRKTAKNNPNIKTEDIIGYAKQGYNSVEIGKLIGCSDSTVMIRLKKALTLQEYNEYKKRNVKNKMANMRKTAYTKDAIQKKELKKLKNILYGMGVMYIIRNLIIYSMQDIMQRTYRLEGLKNLFHHKL